MWGLTTGSRAHTSAFLSARPEGEQESPHPLPGADARRHLCGVDDLQKTRFVRFAEPPNSTQVIGANSNTTCNTIREIPVQSGSYNISTAETILNIDPVLTMIEQRGGADLSYWAFKLETEEIAALRIHTRPAFSLVLQRHCVEV